MSAAHHPTADARYDIDPLGNIAGDQILQEPDLLLDEAQAGPDLEFRRDANFAFISSGHELGSDDPDESRNPQSHESYQNDRQPWEPEGEAENLEIPFLEEPDEPPQQTGNSRSNLGICPDSGNGGPHYLRAQHGNECNGGNQGADQ